jgi:hypothetical protein
MAAELGNTIGEHLWCSERGAENSPVLEYGETDEEHTVLHTNHTLLRHQRSKGRGNSRYEERLHVDTQFQYEQMRQCTIQRNTGARSRNHCCREKKNSITYSECVSVTWVIQHAMLMRRIILQSETCLAEPYFAKLSQKRHDFQK